MTNTDDWFGHLRQLQWVRSVLSKPLAQALQTTILDKVRSTIKGAYDEERFMEALQRWNEAILLPWTRDLVEEDELWCEQLSMAVSRCFCLVRMEEMFDIVADFPDSQPAVKELSRVLGDSQMHSSLADALKTSLIKRLIHPGANTGQIIEVYINTIKVLREIDPSDQLLAVVCEPVRNYLKGRSDTVRCIITR
jgi:anaphase-promoting complex subunit 2